MRYVTVTLSATLKGDRLVLRDKNGKKVGAMNSCRVGLMKAKARKRLKWEFAIKRMVAYLSQKKDRKTLSGWERKFQTWAMSLQFRRHDLKRARKNKRFYSVESRPNWECSFKCMQFQHRRRVYRKLKNETDRWRVWCETCSKNHNRKARNRNATDSQFVFKTGPHFNNSVEATTVRSG
jgi:hypothetical protein